MWRIPGAAEERFCVENGDFGLFTGPRRPVSARIMALQAESARCRVNHGVAA